MKFKKILQISLLLLLASLPLVASDENNDSWTLDRFNFYFENDAVLDTDDGYSSGEKLAWLYYIPNPDSAIYDNLFLEFGDAEAYFSFSVATQVFTPTEKKSEDLIPDDRPFAGWTYFEFNLHEASLKHLQTLSLRVGMVGEVSLAEKIQNGFHKLIGVNDSLGWSNQLKNELGLNLKYTQKYQLGIYEFLNMQSAVTPFVSAELGNIAINATVGANVRVGLNIPKDFGLSTMDIGNDSGISIYGERKNIRTSPWSFSFNLTGYGSAVGRDIFLDGNSFRDSHSVEKENFIYSYGAGVSIRYKKFILDYLHIYNSKRFVLEKDPNGYGSIIFSWLY